MSLIELEHGPTDPFIYYKKRRKYKYTLFRDAAFLTGITPLIAGQWGPLGISEVGLLTTNQGYAWDGPSGPTIDTPSFIRGSLFHDALYQLMREQKISQDYRKRADEILRQVCLQDGMWKVRAAWVYRGVRIGAAKSARPNLLIAPK